MTRKRFQVVAFAVIAMAAITAFLLTNPLSSSAESEGETAILEEGGNMNWALRLARRGPTPTLVGDPTAIYGKIMTYGDAGTVAGSLVVSEGDSQAWRFGRTVLVYVFEGDFVHGDPRTRDVDDWAQKIIVIDEEKGYQFRDTTHRVVAKIDVSPLLPLSIRDDQKDVPPRGIDHDEDQPPLVPADPATPAPPPPKE